MPSRIVKLTLAATLALALLCPPLSQAGQVLERILEKQELRVGLDPTFPPLEAITKKGRLIGFDVDLAELLAAGLGVKLKLVQMPFKDLLPALARGRLDMVISGLTITARRNRKVVFIGPYLMAGQTILIHHKMADRIRGPEDLNKSDLTVVVPKDTTAEEVVRRLMPKARLITTRGEIKAVKKLLQGQAQALVSDLTFNSLMAFRYRSRGIIHLDTPFTFEPLGIAIPQGDPDLANWLHNQLFLLRGAGSLDRLGEKWFHDPTWIEKLP